MTDEPSKKPRYREVLIRDIHVPDNLSRYEKINERSEEFKAFALRLSIEGIINAPTVVEREHTHVPDDNHYAAPKITKYVLDTGEHRLRAWASLGHDKIVVQVFDKEDLFRTLEENFSRFELKPADRASALAKSRAKLMDKGASKPEAERMLAYRLHLDHDKLRQLIRIHDRLIPELFRAFAGKGGKALTIAEAVECCNMTAQDQLKVWETWTAHAGRKDVFEGSNIELHKRQRSRKEIENLYRVLGSGKKVMSQDGEPLSAESRKLALKLLRWAMVPGAETPILFDEY